MSAVNMTTHVQKDGRLPCLARALACSTEPAEGVGRCSRATHIGPSFAAPARCTPTGIVSKQAQMCPTMERKSPSAMVRLPFHRASTGTTGLGQGAREAAAGGTWKQRRVSSPLLAAHMQVKIGQPSKFITAMLGAYPKSPPYSLGSITGPGPRPATFEPTVCELGGGRGVRLRLTLPAFRR